MNHVLALVLSAEDCNLRCDNATHSVNAAYETIWHCSYTAVAKPVSFGFVRICVCVLPTGDSSHCR